MVYVQVVRGGERKQVSIFDLVVGDVVPLSIGGQVDPNSDSSQCVFVVFLLRGSWIILFRLYIERWKICMKYIFISVQVVEFEYMSVIDFPWPLCKMWFSASLLHLNWQL